jgi:hypothetical protein
MEPNSMGFACIKRYIDSRARLDQAERSLRVAQGEATDAECELAKWLMPKDMKPGEKIAVWAGDSLFQVELAPVDTLAIGTNGRAEAVVQHKPKITVRTRGPKYDELAR